MVGLHSAMAAKVTPLVGRLPPTVEELVAPTATPTASSPTSASLLQGSPTPATGKKRPRVGPTAGQDDPTQRKRNASIVAAVAARRLQPRSHTTGPSISKEVGEEFVRRLRALFHACDADEDNALTPNELLVLLELMGGSAAEARAFGATTSGFFTSSDRRVSFDRFLEMCHSLIVRCARERRPLPPTGFVARCKPLKHGFHRCDTDGSHEISRTELEIALQKLGHVVTDDDLDDMVKRLDPNGDGRIEWSDFLYVAWQDSLADPRTSSSVLRDYFSLEHFADLPSFIRASPSRQRRPSPHKRARRGAVSITPPTDEEASDESSTDYVSRVERMGVEFLTRVSKQRVDRVKRATVTTIRHGATVERAEEQERKTSVLPRQTLLATAGWGRRAALGDQQMQEWIEKQADRPERRHGFSPEALLQIRQIEWIGALLGGLAGLASGMLSIGLEAAILTPAESGESWTYYFYLLLINIVVSLVEVSALYITAVVCAFRLTVSAGLTLYPLDQERDFLVRAVARAALQVAHRKDTLFGMDPMRGSPRLALLLTYFVYKSKRYVLKFLLKFFIKRVLWRAAARSALSFAVLPVNGLTNAWTLRRVLRNCRINIVGPPCAIAALEAFLLEDACFAPAQRVDYMRVLGCCLVCKRAVHPNIEIMVEHLRHRWMNADVWPVGVEGCTCLSEPEVACEPHALDDMDIFLVSLRVLGSTAAATTDAATSSSLLLAASSHLRNVFFLLIVTLLIDGSLDWTERRFYVRACEAAG
ncbi:hypothetical protein BBJ28_00015840, partial [Nothophytophthora sp. Chile5]